MKTTNEQLMYQVIKMYRAQRAFTAARIAVAQLRAIKLLQAKRGA